MKIVEFVFRDRRWLDKAFLALIAWALGTFIAVVLKANGW